MSTKSAPAVKLPSGTSYPLVGLGTFTIFNATGKPGAVRDAVKYAIDIGYRHIDCAWIYQNESEVGDAIQDKLDDGTIKDKKEVFITAKLWDTHHNPKDVKENVMKSLKNLRVDSIHLYLVHWPFAFQDGDDYFPKDKDGKLIFADHDYIDTWKAMEGLVEAKLVDNLGISNFNRSQIDRLLQHASIKPCNHQIEVHPYLSNRKLVEYCQSKGISVTAYAPLGNVTRSWAQKDEPIVFDEPILQEMAKRKGKSIAQIVLRFLIQRNLVVIPKSVTPSRIKENMEIFDFELSHEDMQKIWSLDRNMRFYKESAASDHKYYPFHDEY